MGVPGSTAVACGAPEVYRAASALLGEAFAPAADAAATFYTVNTCSWPRTETARLFLPESTVALDHAVQVRDARTGAPLPFVEEAQSNERHRAAGRFLHVPVADVPACGAVRLDIVPVAERSAPGDGDSGLSGDPTVVENDHLRVTVDLREACISSIVDKATGREMVRQDAAVGFNGYVYDEYATAGAFNHQSSKTVADDSMHLLASRSTAPPAALVDRVTDATGQTLVYACSPAGTRGLRVRVHLPHHAARIDIENRIDKDATLTKESAFFAFPFALDNPVVHTEATGGVLGTDRETVPGSATHMRAVRRWISLSDGNSHAALATADAPLIQLGGIAIPYVPYPQSLRQEEPATVFSWVHNNIWDSNFPTQQAFDHVFRYGVGFGTTAENPTVQADQLALRVAAVTSHPLVPVRAREEGSSLPPAQTQFLTLDDSRVRLVGVTVPGDGRLMVRVQSLADTPVTCRLRTPFSVARAVRTNYLGLDPRDIGQDRDGAVPVDIPPLGTAAVVLHLDPSARPC